MAKEHPSIEDSALNKFFRCLILSSRLTKSHINVFMVTVLLPIGTQPFVSDDSTIVGPMSSHVYFSLFVLTHKPSSDVESFDLDEPSP